MRFDEEPPVGSIVEDSFGNRWQRSLVKLTSENELHLIKSENEK